MASRQLSDILYIISLERVLLSLNKNQQAYNSKHNLNKKGQLSLTNPRDACETFARFT